MNQLVLIQEEPRGPSQLIEVPVPTNGLQRVAFPDIQQLRSLANQTIILKQMRLITPDVLTFGVISGSANAPVTELQKISIVLYCEGWEKAQFIPILTLNDMVVDALSTAAHRFQPTSFNDWQAVDWSKSYLQFSNTQVSVGAPYVVMFDVQYIKLDAQGAVIIGPS